MEKKAVRVAYGEALCRLGEQNDRVVVLVARPFAGLASRMTEWWCWMQIWPPRP